MEWEVVSKSRSANYVVSFINTSARDGATPPVSYKTLDCDGSTTDAAKRQRAGRAQHPGPVSLPNESNLVSHNSGGLSCFRAAELPEESACLIAATSACLYSEDDQTTSPTDELGVRSLFGSSGLSKTAPSTSAALG